ncbi:hypothetical protein P3339_14250 [Microbulbifer sp. MLAF003]|uniref:hypothetical protein n=1 Tax=unclassified Microbulbifer TaxID=2619833 RepID=UPI0024AD68F6|nr:hypothetical protein [Microbulbifer sp. MLAF003]WHI49631.1 hypothetical protein P3339_14250 [Microbulbifer sp. MLAF003]
MGADVFTNTKIEEMIEFCSKGYDAWTKIINKDVANNYKSGRERSADGQVYWNDLNSEASCILAIHSFLREYLTSRVPASQIAQLDNLRDRFRIAAVDYQRLCSTAFLTKEIDKEIDKNNALKKDRRINFAISASSLASSVNDISSKINGVVATIIALKGLRINLASQNTSWREYYKMIRRDFLAIASNVVGLFAPTAVGNTIIIAWMYSDTRDYMKFQKTGQQLTENKQDLLKAADKFSGDTSICDFYTYVLVTALAEHYGFSPNNGINYNLQHEHLAMTKGVLARNTL